MFLGLVAVYEVVPRMVFNIRHSICSELLQFI